ncbi:MAG: chemotaxis protein CheW [Desulfobulbaceae bacterium DB1]|nr:MAG: chemotaxis protein CheW [Desulfobulbaceae bacterium DB1]
MAHLENAQAGTKQNVKDLAGKYLTFDLGREEYGIGILKVREIIGLMEITAVPHTPRYIKGVINLRGSVIPVLDLRLKFNMDSQEYNERTCIIVVEVQGESGVLLVGMIVDSVSEVLNIVESEIEPPPSFGGDLETGNFLGMAKIKGRVKILLDVDEVIGEAGLRSAAI